MPIRLRDRTSSQLDYLAGTFRLVAMGQLAVFGWKGIQENQWWAVVVSALAAGLLVFIGMYVLEFDRNKGEQA